ncbi:hypothetical protein PLEOSDRAFT_1106798 [Pleurotus ostreatus PC15]|uniref:Uncharacterized protein n=1 Tax=Pleurotus ostreatus (strain PC15) TaxID=1137138 RepID=A0A067NP88_PLEO1|nr:hypothetical protein PLEOSDRAFT_1106798 [Pleurotus ostreatus PC15]
MQIQSSVVVFAPTSVPSDIFHQCVRFLNERDANLLILQFLSLKSFHAYGLTCKIAYLMAKRYLRVHYNIDQSLSVFIPIADIAYFRNAQQATGTLIGGSFVLQFFTRITYKMSDIDLYVHQFFADELMNALCAIGCQCSLPPTKLTALVYSPFTNQVVNFLSPTDRDIQVIVTYCRPIQAIFAYHSSGLTLHGSIIDAHILRSAAVMNFLSGWYVYSLYGDETLDEGLSMYLCPDGGDQHGAKSKYERRGWITVADRQEANTLAIFSPLPHLVGDEITWVIKLDSSTVRGVHGYRDPFIRDACWMLSVADSGHSYISTL